MPEPQPPPSPTESVTSLSAKQPASDKRITAETVETVMAEQSSRNEVDSTKSMGAAALVDAAVNHITTDSAAPGTSSEQAPPQTKTEELQTSQNLNAHASTANANISSTDADAVPSDAVAEPSAGEATKQAADASIPKLAVEGVKPAGTVLQGSKQDGMQATVDGVPEDVNVPEGSVDISLNSDTEGSRGDATEQKKADGHHIRTNSVKKPTSFSKVSVTKNFLAKSSSNTPATAKVPEKPSPVGTPSAVSAARPRLIAKTGASLQPKSALRTDGSSGPDASKVWNKNRPVAPPPPKHFTDEELKQQYGIHLATRIQTDENGKEKNWADIDEDDDDWAPDAVVWMDGTKSSLTPQEASNAQKELKASAPQLQKSEEPTRPTLALKRPTESSASKTILKPGAKTLANQEKQIALSPAHATSRPSQSISPAPPSKSPWATLPPVDKISPINPPVQQQPLSAPRLATQDARAYEPQPPAQPARQIAADTFDRSWREGEGGARELFNSANGKYEPVQEGRRGSIKPDSAYRKPALLQRSSQAVTSPAEPSAAFQSRTTNQMDGPWARRRGSSVSQHSGPGIRRVSTSKGSDISPAPERRTSTVVGHDMRANVTRNEPAQPVFAQQSAWQQQMPPRPEGNIPEEEDPVKVQERVMKEKRELAKKRREEEEAREAAEKKERLQKRLAALEGAGKSRKEREAEAAAAAAAAARTPTPTIAASSEVTSFTPATDASEPKTSHAAQTPAAAAPALEAQTIPPAPIESPPRQQPFEERLPSPLPPKPPVTSLPERPASSTDQAQRQQVRPHLSPRANARASFQAQPSPYGSSASPYSPSPGDRKQQPVTRSPLPSNSTFTPWGVPAPNTNVWGSSGIGNGTFQSAPAFPPTPQISGLPIIPNARSAPSSRISPESMAQGSHSPSLQQQANESHRGLAPPGFGDQFNDQLRVNGASPITNQVRQPQGLGPIARPPPAQVQPQQQQALSQAEMAAKWRSAADTLPDQYNQAKKDAMEEASERVAPSAPRDDTIKETFKKTAASTGRLGGPRKYAEAEYTIHDSQGSRTVQSLSPAPPQTQSQPMAPFPTASPLSQEAFKQPQTNTVRIPDPSINAPHRKAAQQPPIAPPAVQQQQPCKTAADSSRLFAQPLAPISQASDAMPPSTDNALHPLNTGWSGHPIVKLPPGKPVVKLPPTSEAYMPQQSVMMPPRPAPSYGSGPRPIVQQQEWQARFNGLFGRAAIHTEVPPSPPKTPPKAQGPALAVAASSKSVLDEMPNLHGATVSLPQARKRTTPEGFAIDDSRDVVSKPMTEQVFTEERSFGSTPKVVVPRNPRYASALYRGTPSLMHNDLKPQFLVNARSTPQFDMQNLHYKRAPGIFVNLPMLNIKNKMVRHPQSSRKSSAPFSDRKPSGKFNNKGKAKEAAQPVPSLSGSASNASKSETSQSPAATSATNNETKKSAWAKPPKGNRYPRSAQNFSRPTVAATQ